MLNAKENMKNKRTCKYEGLTSNTNPFNQTGKKVMKTLVFIKINDSKKEISKGRKIVHFQSNTLEGLLRLRLVEEQWSRCRLLAMQQIESSK